jgi:phosphoserine phosphatase
VRSSELVAPPFLVVLDIDSTLINEEGLDLVAQRAGDTIFRRVEDITASAMAGEMDFAESLTRRVALLQGLPLAQVTEVSRTITATPGARELIDWVHASGGVVGAVSGGFHEVIDDVARGLGVDRWVANRFEVTAGVLTGRVLGDIVDAGAKARHLTTWASDLGVDPRFTVAIGDGANDVAMFSVAGLSVSFCGKAIANDHADVVVSKRNLAAVIDHVDRLLSVTHSQAPVDGNHSARNV